MKKRILSMLLSIVMVVGLMPGFAVTASAAAEDETTTVYFRNDWTWSAVNFYCWDADENPVGATWPGKAMELYGNDGTHDIYKTELPAGAAGFQFNDGTDNFAFYSPDIKSGWYDGICYYMVWNGDIALGSANIADIENSASEEVAKVNGTSYTSFAGALAAAQSTANSTLTLLADIAMQINVPSGTFTLDLNGHSITMENRTALAIRKDAAVTVTDSSDAGTGSINGYPGVAVYGGSVTMEGGTVNGMIGVEVGENGSVAIEGGTVNGTIRAVAVEAGTVLISGGSINCSEDTGVWGNSGSITITGGELRSYRFDVYTTSNCSCVISGGTFWTNPAIYPDVNYLAEGYTTKLDEQSFMYVVVPKPATPYPLWIGGEQFTSEKLTVNGTTGTATYDPVTKTLTLNNYTYTGAGYMYDTARYAASIYYGDADTLNLVLAGTNKVENNGDGVRRSRGMHVNGSLIVSGTGTLTLNGGAVRIANGQSRGMFVNTDLTVLSGTLTCNAGEAMYSTGVCLNGKLTVSGGTLTASGSTSTAANSDSTGVYVYSGGVTVSGGTLTAIGGQADDSMGINTDGKITVSGGALTAISGQSKNYSQGMFTANVMEVSGGEVTVISGQAGFGSYGMEIQRGITVSGGKVTATGGQSENNSYGLATNNVLAVSGTGTVIAEAAGKAVYLRKGITVADTHAVYGSNGEVIANPDYTALSYVKIAATPTTADIRIAAVDAADGREVVGAILQILDSKGTVEAEWTSLLDIHVEADLAIGEIYTLKAIYAPKGYVLPAKVTFTIDENGKVTSTGTTTVDSDGNTVMRMEFSKTKVSVLAADVADGDKLEGAILQIIDPNGNVMNQWTSADTACFTEGLHTGKEYILRATVAPDGYSIPADIAFTIDESGKVTSTGTVDENGTLLVEFEAAKFDVRFVDWDGSTLKLETVPYGKAATAPADPTREGYTFTGWDKAFDNITGKLTVKAQYTVNTHDIIYMVNGEEYSRTSDVAFGTAIQLIAAPTREGYTFSGWSEAPATMPDKDVTITGTFTQVEYEVEIEQPAGGNVTIDNETPNMGDDVTITVTPDEGEEVVEVIVKDENGDKIDVTQNPDGSYTYEQPAGDVTIEVTMKDSEYEVEIEQPNGGKVETDNENPKLGDDVTITVTPDEGKEVVDVIVKDENGHKIDVTQNPDGSYTYEQPAGDVTVEVGLKLKEHDIIYMVDGVEYDRVEKVAYGTEITLIAEPDKTGYTFSGWNAEIPATMPDKEVVIRGTFTINQYTIAFDTDGGTVIVPITQDYNTEVTPPADPTKTGYDFGGWYTDAELTTACVFGTMPAANITVYAKWNPATGTAYTVKHYHQNTSGSGYTLYESETLRGMTNDETAAEAKNYPGFTAQTFARTTILPDGTTVVEIKYDRNIYTVTLVTNKGTIRDVDVTEYTYGVGSKLPANVTRSGYYFGGWYENEDCKGTPVSEITTNDIGNKTFYAKWNFIYIPIVTPTYPPVVDGGDNGDVTVTPKNPEMGDTVVITPAPDAGYEVDEITVTDKNGNPITVIDNGDGTYSFKQPSGKVNIEVTFREIVKVCPGDKTCPMYGFTDLDSSAWYHDGVHFCIANDLMTGTASDTFAPGMTTSRAMIVTILWRLEDKPVVNYAMSFKDVAADTWYTEAVRWAQANKIVSGYSDEAFGPNDVITREQLATILYRYEQYKGGGFTGAWMIRMDYVDLADVSDWAYETMCWMNMNGIVNGKPGKVLDPKGSATRAEAATMLYRYCEISSKEDN